MTIEFKEGDAKDFMTFSKEPPPHSLMEGHIIEIRLRIVLSKTNDKNEILNRLSSLSTNES